MSLRKAIESGKEHRRGYRERGKPGEYDPTCRPHGGGYPYPCPWCENNRLFSRRKLARYAEDMEKDFSHED